MSVKKLMMRGLACPSQQPFIIAFVKFEERLIGWKSFKPYLIDGIVYDDIGRASHDLGIGIVRRIINNCESIPVVVEYHKDPGEMKLKNFILLLVLMPLVVLCVLFATWLH